MHGERLRPPDAGPESRWTWWAIATGVGVLAASQWLHSPRVEYLVALLLATAAALGTLVFVRGAQRSWAVASSALLAVTAGLAVPAQRDLWRVNNEWPIWQRDASIRALDKLRHALDDAIAWSTRAAHVALDAPADRAAAFDALKTMAAGSDERGLVLLRNDTATAWGGTLRVRIDTARAKMSFVATPFYLVLVATDEREGGATRAAASALVDAAPPADRLSTPLATRVARENGLTGFVFQAASDTAVGAGVLRVMAGTERLFDVRARPLVQSEVAFRVVEGVRVRAGLAFLFSLACFIIGVWRGTWMLSRRMAALAVALGATALVPLNQYSNISRLFNASVYYTGAGGALTGNAGALATTSALVLLGLLGLFRRRGRPVSRWVAVTAVLLVAGLGPFLLRELARGIRIPAHGVSVSLWLVWEVPLFLAAVSVLLAGAGAGGIVVGRSRGLPPALAPLVATIAALLAPVVWQAPGQWPWWYTFLWIGAIATLALSRQTRYVIASTATVAALGATTLVWARTARGRVELAETDLQSLSQVDSNTVMLARRFGAALRADAAPQTRQELLQHYVASTLAPAGNPVALFAYPTDSGPTASFEVASIPIPSAALRDLVARARRTGDVETAVVPTDTTLELVMAARGDSGGVTAVVVAPRSRLFDVDPFSRLIGLDVDAESAEPPYTVRLRAPAAAGVVMAGDTSVWFRERSVLHGDRTVRTGARATPAHVEIELRPLNALVPRGALLVLLDLAIVGVLWLASVTADGGAGRWFRARRRRWARSYRARLSIALLAFFIIPALAFAIWSYGQLATDATQSRALLVRETLRSVAPPPDTAAWLARESDRLDSPLFLYRRGRLAAASDSLLQALAPIGRFLDPRVEVALDIRDEQTATLAERVAGFSTLFGYRSVDQRMAPGLVLAAPARADELALGRRRSDLGVLVLFATAIGALGALGLSGIAARQLARPIRTLREAALALAGGARLPPLEGEPTVEFRPVFTAFRRMAADLNASRTALEDAQRRTAAVLRNVASGVVAVDKGGRITLANPRAEALIEHPLAADMALADVAPRELATLVEDFLASDTDDEEFELETGQRQLRGRLTRLARSGGGAVVTLDDVTALARAQRVLAWGEMARQVAHEIKNPLTPIRLGVQHLRRARSAGQVDFDRVLDHNVNQILAEIDRLDEIARAFSRYGSGPGDRLPPEPVDVSAVVREVVALEQMGEPREIEWTEEGVDAPLRAMARSDELKEVLLNVLENARHAAARRVSIGVAVGRDGDRGTVVITVRDDGQGIPADVLPRVFEPHFSTRTSGSGLGLAISRQIVDGWGGDIGLESVVGQGTVVRIKLRSAEKPDGADLRTAPTS